MAAKGEVTPMPDFAVFSDTQAEPGFHTRHLPKGQREGVYGWLDWLEDQLPFPIHVVSKGSLTEDQLRVRRIQKEGCQIGPVGTPYLRQTIPIFGIKPNGDVGASMTRKCTDEFKVREILKAVRKYSKLPRGHKELHVTQWIGISMDEMSRAKYPKDPWTQHRWPLLELKMKRKDCIQWMMDNKFPEPPRSACVYCPFHNDGEWLRLKNNDPVGWKEAVRFDKELRDKYSNVDESMQMEVFLHKDCKPLDEIEFKPGRKDDYGFEAECEGMCGM